MAGELIAVDLQTVHQKIADKIRSAFVDLIPPEAWREMVTKEIKWFQEDARTYGRDVDPAPLRLMIRRELQETFKAHVKAEVGKPEYFPGMPKANGLCGPGEAVKAIVAGLLPQIIQEMMGSFVQDYVNKMRNG